MTYMNLYSQFYRIKLLKLRENPFEKYPEFRSIWPLRQQEVEEDCLNFLSKPYKEDKFLIVKYIDGVQGSEIPIGITGYFELDGMFILAWHGVLPDERKNGYSAEALSKMAFIIHLRFPRLTEVVELVPQDREEEVGSYFKKLGFVKTGRIITHPDLVQDVVWLEYKCEIDKLYRF